MQNLDMEYLNEYKPIDKICSDMFGGQGVTSYIEEMESAPFGIKTSIPGWQAYYDMLKHLRWLRNRIAHDDDVDYEVTPADIDNLHRFHNDILSQQDPLALLYKETEKRRQEQAERESQLKKQKAAEFQKQEVQPIEKTPTSTYEPEHSHRFLKFLLFIAIITIIGLIVLGVFMGYGPFHSVRNLITASYEGNAKQYDFDKIEFVGSTPLENKNICVLGSSVVYGYASQEQSIAEYLSARFGCTCTKEAVSGTTLVDSGPLSYVSRMKKLDKNAHYDLFICQLSTNDATKKKPLGEISQTGEYDTSTVTGAMEYIINYATDTWHCPVVFFTGSHYDSEEYDAMVSRLLELKEKYGIGVIDLWNDEEFNNITDEQRTLYMSDNVHPTKAGYRDWWGPEFERQLFEYLAEVQE